MAQLSRIDRLARTYDPSKLKTPLTISSTATVSVALIPPHGAPTASTTWTSVTYSTPNFPVLIAGPDADSTGSTVILTAAADLWMRAVDGTQTTAVFVERFTLDGDSTSLQPPPPLAQVLSVNGKTGALSLSFSDVGAASTSDARLSDSRAATDASVAALVNNASSSTTGALRAAYVSTIGRSNGTDDTAALNAALTTARTAGGGYVRGLPGQTYLLSAPLEIGSHTTLDMTNCTIQLLPGAGCNLLRNRATTAARTVMDLVTTSGSTTATSATAAFTTADNGVTVWIYGAAGRGQIHKTTMTYVNATTVTLAAAPAATLTAAVGSIGPRDTAITVRGGTWARGNVDGTYINGANIIMFRRADQVTILDATATSSVGKYAINFGDCTDVLVERPTFDTYSDGVHLNGPIKGATIRSVRGHTRDDSVSLTPNDYSPYNDVYGDITDVLIEDVRTLSDNRSVVILGGSPATAARRVVVDGVFGYATETYLGAGGGVGCVDDTGRAETTGGLIDDITLRNIMVRVPDNIPMIDLNALNLGKIAIDGASFDNTTNSAEVIRVTASSPATVERLSIRNLHVENSAKAVLAIYPNVGVSSLVLDNVYINKWGTGDNSSSIIGNGGRITDAHIRTLRVASLNGGYLLNAYAPITSLVMSDIDVTPTQGAPLVNLIWVNGTTVGDLSIGDSKLAISGYLVVMAANSTLSRYTVHDLHLPSGAGLLASNGAPGSSVPILEASNVVTATNWGIGGLGGTTTVYLSNYAATPATNLAYLEAGTAITIYGQNVTVSGPNTALQGTAGTVHSRALGLPVDVSNPCLAKSANDLAFNTNATLSCGVGPVGYTGAAWKHLITGATY